MVTIHNSHSLSRTPYLRRRVLEGMRVGLTLGDLDCCRRPGLLEGDVVGIERLLEVRHPNFRLTVIIPVAKAIVL